MALEAGDPARLGPFELVDRLGEGGQGVVYLGRGPAGEAVAVKLLHHRFVQDPEARHRFLQEVALAQRVARFCTAPVLHADLAGDRPYVVSEFIPGPSLRQLVERDGPRRGAALDRIAISTATALAAIHRAGITHRDFKPANVLMGPEGPVVIDFGVARALDSPQATATGTTIGTPSYLAPELLNGGTATPAADIFAWGVTMVFAATGRPAFGADTIPSVITRILTAEPDLGPLTGLFRDLVAACLSKDPALRPSAEEIVARLTGGPTGPMPVPTGQAVRAGTGQAGTAQAGTGQAGTARAGSVPPGRARRRRPPLLLPLALAAVTTVAAAGTVTVISLSGSAGNGQSLSKEHGRAVASAPADQGDEALGDGALGDGVQGDGALGDGEEIGAVPSPSHPASPSARGRANRPTPRVRHTPLPTLPRRPSPTAAPSRAASQAPPPPKPSQAPSPKPSPQPSRQPSSAPSPKPSPKPSPTPSPKPSPKPSPTAAPKPNPHTPKGLCGSAFNVINSHSYAGGAATTYLLYNPSTGNNCVVTLSKYVVPEKIKMSALLQVQGGASTADSGSYTVYAGPLKLAAAKKCVIWGGGYGSSTWSSAWSHCG